MTTDDSTVQRALKLLDKGLVTMSEAAVLAGASRQLVRFWCKRAGIDPKSARARRVLKLWRAQR